MKLRWSYAEAEKHAQAITDARTARIRKVARQAGLDPDYHPHAHNAMCSYNQGRPWPGVDYSLVRKVLWLQSHQFDAYRVLDRYRRRRDAENRLWIVPNQGKFA